MRIRQRDRIMQFLTGYIASNGEGPTIKEIGEFFGWSSPATVFDKLVALENMGLIRREYYKSRRIEIVK